VIGLIVAIDKFRVITFWKNHLASFIIFSFAYFIIKNKLQVKSLIIAIIVWGLLLALIEFKVLLELGGFTAGIIGLFFKKNLLTLGWGRSNYLSAFFVVIIPFTIGYWLYTNSRKLKIFITFSLILMSFAIILTLSRGGILALIIALIILFFKVLKPRTVIPLLTVLTIIIIVLLLNPLTYVLVDSISALEKSGSVYSRINFYIDTWNAFLKYPITGVGFGNLGLYAKFILPMYEAPSAHNIVLGALGEVGIVGTIFYGAIFVVLFKTLFSLYKNENDERLKMLKWSAFAALLGGLIHTLVEPTFEGLQFSIVFWIIASISIKLDLLKNDY
jgi:O-antigen ligase